MSLKVAAIQMVSGASVQANLEAARALLAQAAAQGAELAVLPEYFCLMGLKETDKLAIRETPGDGPIQNFLSQAARELGLWIVGGTLPLANGDASPSRALNSSLAYAPSGQCVARYDKIHLFRFAGGGEAYRVGMSVCYDLRFPELYRTLRADVLLVPSAFTYVTGQAHWELLLRARAIENLAYVLAAAQGGTHENGRRTWGHSMVIGPWGEILAQQGEGEGAGVVMGEVLCSRLKEVRQRLPALNHRVL